MTDMELIIFDMDGTICDSWPAMLYCYRETLKEWGYGDMPDEEFWSYFVGYLPDNLRVMLHIQDDEELNRAVAFFRRKYEEKGHAMGKPFDHVPDTIRELHSRGFKIGLATMTLEKYAVNTLRELGILDCFDVAVGSPSEGHRTKTDMIRLCMERTGIDGLHTLMVGDGFNDLEAAKKAGTHFLAAAYGFGLTAENCIEYGTSYVDEPGKVLDAILGFKG